VKETHALALFPGGFGTMDEGFEVLTLMQTGKARIIPLVLVERPGGTYWETWMEFISDDLYKSGYIGAEDFKLFKIVHTPAEAVAEILQFYKIYHSARWVGDQLVLRLTRTLSEESVARLNEEFADIVRSGRIAQTTALRQEKNEPEIWNLPRLVLHPHRKSFGRFRELIDGINRG
ncbi:MAG TPA: LOG family protein, partial [Chthoniobacterales bacterium]|nr:LOG family protein [Chthoniobacterales bacterium]